MQTTTTIWLNCGSSSVWSGRCVPQSMRMEGRRSTPTFGKSMAPFQTKTPSMNILWNQKVRRGFTGKKSWSRDGSIIPSRSMCYYCVFTYSIVITFVIYCRVAKSYNTTKCIDYVDDHRAITPLQKCSDRLCTSPTTGPSPNRDQASMSSLCLMLMKNSNKENGAQCPQVKLGHGHYSSVLHCCLI